MGSNGGSNLPNPFAPLNELVKNTTGADLSGASKFNPLLFAAGGAGFGASANLAKNQLVDQPREQAMDAARVQKDQQRATQAAVDENNKKMDLTRIRDEERAKQKAASLASLGRAGTILTSPLGVVDSGTNQSKTLLGQ